MTTSVTAVPEAVAMPSNGYSVIAHGIPRADITASTVVSISLPRTGMPAPFIGPEPGASADLQGSRLLQQLSLLSVPRVAEFLASNPSAVEGLLSQPPAAREVTMWWNALDFEHRGAVLAASPQLVGNLEGVPYTTRDVANRAYLADTIAELGQTIADKDAGRTTVDQAERQLVMLDSISEALVTATTEPDRTLLSLDVMGQGRAAIVLGDLRTADYVSYLVPGMFFTIENQMGDWAGAASDLYIEQLEWLDRLDQPNDTVATIAWIGYPTPNLTNVGGIGNAEIGRDSLARSIEGLQTLRGEDEPYLSVIAHSYGSTAALLALTEYDFEIDALAMVGSPGSPAKSIAELNVRGGNVWVGEAPWDPIPNSSYFGSDPGSVQYGASPMGVSGGSDPVTQRTLLGSSGHNEYFTTGTESMRNFALIAIGREDLVTGAAGGSETPVVTAEGPRSP